jgi:prefoldin subunit 5
MAKKEFEELTKQKTELQGQIAEIDKKIKPLTAYLQAIGALKGAKRGRKPKEATAAAKG